MVRTVSSSLLSLLVTATLMWGGCVSCEQYFMFAGKQKSQSCCNKSGKCERPGKNPSKPEKQDCNFQSFSRGENANMIPLPAILTATIAVELQPRPSSGLFRASAFEAPIDPSPPDLQALNATFLI